MSKLITGVRFRPHRVTLGGALGGLLEFAGRDLPQPYLMGVTGHAFRLTSDVVFSPSGPVELNFHEVFPLWENVGAWFRRVAAKPADQDFDAVREDALHRIRESVDQGRPAIVYDLLNVPEYGLVVGYEGDRLACLTLTNPEEPAWMEAAEWPPQAHASFTRAEVIQLLDLAPAFDARRAEVQSLRFAVDHFWAPASRDMWLQHGKNAYEFWAAVLGSAMPLHGPEAGMGHTYNVMHLHRARRDAAVYLGELAGKYPEAASLQGAAKAYAEVAAILEEGTRVAPFPGQGLAESAELRRTLADCIKRAMAAERRGIDEIERALRALR